MPTISLVGSFEKQLTATGEISYNGIPAQHHLTAVGILTVTTPSGRDYKVIAYTATNRHTINIKSGEIESVIKTLNILSIYYSYGGTARIATINCGNDIISYDIIST